MKITSDLAQVLLFMGEWRVGAHWALGRGAAADTGSTNHSANVLYGDNPDLIPASAIKCCLVRISSAI